MKWNTHTQNCKAESLYFLSIHLFLLMPRSCLLKIITDYSSRTTNSSQISRRSCRSRNDKPAACVVIISDWVTQLVNIMCQHLATPVNFYFKRDIFLLCFSWDASLFFVNIYHLSRVNDHSVRDITIKPSKNHFSYINVTFAQVNLFYLNWHCIWSFKAISRELNLF